MWEARASICIVLRGISAERATSKQANLYSISVETNNALGEACAPFISVSKFIVVVVVVVSASWSEQRSAYETLRTMLP